jgi:hypothetical protein
MRSSQQQLIKKKKIPAALYLKRFLSLLLVDISSFEFAKKAGRSIQNSRL